MSNWNKLKQKIGASDKKKEPAVEKGKKTHQENEDSFFPTNLDPEEKKLLGMLKRLRDKAVALDCEMVGTGMNGKYSELARCSLVDSKGNVIYDEFVQPKGYVTDFRTQWSGIRKSDINKRKAVTLEQCQQDVLELLKGRLLVGHALQNDLKVLMVSHPRIMIRDTSRYPPYMRVLPSGKKRARALKDLTKQFLQKTIQSGEHDSAEDARCTMDLYLRAQREWEVILRQKKLKGKETTMRPSSAILKESLNIEENEDEISEEEDRDKQENNESTEKCDEVQTNSESDHQRENTRIKKRALSSTDREENTRSQPLLKKRKTEPSDVLQATDAAKYVPEKNISHNRPTIQSGDSTTKRPWITKQQRRDQRKLNRQVVH